MKSSKNKAFFAFILSTMIVSFAIGNYEWFWRWHSNPVEETSLYHLSDNQSDKNKIFILFSHGVGAHPGTGIIYKIRNHLPPNSDYYGFTYEDQSFYFPFHGQKNINFAQASDIECLKNAYSDSYDLINNNQYQIIIVYGVSRGATTPLTVLANIDDDENARKFFEKVNAFVLESAFASMDDVIENISKITKTLCSPLSWITKKTIGLSQNSVHNIMDKIFQGYDKNGMSACNAIDTIHKENGATLKTLLNKPIFLVCTKKDFQVPVYSTVKLYYMLKDIGHKKVDIYIADKGIHGTIAFFGDKDDYRKALHAFYKKNNIPCDEKLAEEGLAILEQGKKNAEEIKNHTKKYFL